MTKQRETMPADLTITRPGNQIDGARIEIRIRLSRGRTITAFVTPEQFALTLTGLTDVPAIVTLRNVEVIQQ